MSTFTEDLAALNFADDVEVNVDDSYQDALPPAPIPERDYRLRITKWSLDKDKSGNLRLTDGKFPVVLIEETEVVEPVEFAGKRGISYERVNTKPFERPKGSGSLCSMLGDLTRSFDQTRHWKKTNEGLELLAELAATGTFQARLRWEGYDKEYVDTRVAELGGTSLVNDDQMKELRKQAAVKGMKRFPKQPDGTHAPVAKGPSGADVEARLKLGSIYPSSKAIKF
jgi:hypothetical protein